MHARSTPARSDEHCYGIVMHHRLAWWLVEFPEAGRVPLRARKLSGRLTPALAAWLRAETGDPRLGDDVAALNPESRCWCGEFSYRPSSDGGDLFDIDAHPWGSEAGELETRLARTMIDATLHPVPAGFVSVFTALPGHDPACGVPQVRIETPIPLLCLPSVACGVGGPSSMSGPPNFYARTLTRPPKKSVPPLPAAAALTGVRPAAGFPVNVPDLPDHRMP